MFTSLQQPKSRLKLAIVGLTVCALFLTACGDNTGSSGGTGGGGTGGGGTGSTQITPLATDTTGGGAGTGGSTAMTTPTDTGTADDGSGGGG